MDPRNSDAYERLIDDIAARGLDPVAIETRLRAQRVETPSWGYGNSGTRFRVFPQPGVPRDPFERLEDAAEVQRHTGVCPSVAIHIPWDRVDDYGALRERAAALGLRIGAVNPNLFQEEDYRLGSVCHPDARVRRKAVAHLLECVDVARAVGSDTLSLWLADGTNYPGQDDLRDRRRRLLDSLTEVYAALPDGMQLLLEYKLYEPAFYHTDLADWGAALTICRRLGERARVLVDFGHHAQGVNVAHVVALLLEEERLGGFHFNDRKYGDDDLITGAVNPFELFLVFVELARDEETLARVACMLDQSHNVEPKIEALILSVMNLQAAYAKALLVDRAALTAAQLSGDILGAHQMLHDAFATDVRPLCAKVRVDLGASADPLAAFRASGYLERTIERRVGAGQAGSP